MSEPYFIDPSQCVLEPGSEVSGRFRVIEQVGRGGMGWVFRVTDRLFDGDVVALKLLAPSNSADDLFSRRLRNEFALARHLSHPNIVRVFDLGEAGHGYFYITMEFVDGLDLARHADEFPGRRLPLDRALLILLEVAIALDAAHRRGVLHRDVKPENVFLPRGGGLKLGDFGAARSMPVDSSISGSGELIGTPHYMAPEQLRGENPDARADIYSLGILAYELLAGELPFQDQNVLAIVAQHVNRDIPDLRGLNVEVPTWYQDFVEICTEKRPENRFQSAAEVAEVVWQKLALLGITPRLSCLPATIPTLIGRGWKWRLSGLF